MTEEQFKTASSLNHDIEVLRIIGREQTRNNWVGFRIPVDNPIDSFRSPQIQNDFAVFIAAELEKAQKLFEEI